MTTTKPNHHDRPPCSTALGSGTGDCAQVLPEFGRWRDVQQMFGIKRGTLYRLIADGKIRSITLREPGRKFGRRLIHLQSVREHLHALMAKQMISAALR